MAGLELGVPFDGSVKRETGQDAHPELRSARAAKPKGVTGVREELFDYLDRLKRDQRPIRIEQSEGPVKFGRITDITTDIRTGPIIMLGAVDCIPLSGITSLRYRTSSDIRDQNAFPNEVPRHLFRLNQGEDNPALDLKSDSQK